VNGANSELGANVEGGANLPDAFGNEAGDAGFDPSNSAAEAANLPDAFGNEAGDAGFDPSNSAAEAANLPDAFGNLPGDAGYDPNNAGAETANLPDAFGNLPGDAGYDPSNSAAEAANLPDAFGNLPGDAGYDPNNAGAETANLPDAFGNLPGSAGYDPQNAEAQAASLPDAFGNQAGDPGFDPNNTSAEAANPEPYSITAVPGKPLETQQEAFERALRGESDRQPATQRDDRVELGVKGAAEITILGKKIGGEVELNTTDGFKVENKMSTEYGAKILGVGVKYETGVDDKGAFSKVSFGYGVGSVEAKNQGGNIQVETKLGVKPSIELGAGPLGKVKLGGEAGITVRPK